MIQQIAFALRLAPDEYRRLLAKRPWEGKWDDDGIADIKGKIKQQLTASQHNCAYCGLPFKGSKDKQIEHIAPKAKFRQPQFTFTLKNLVLSCGYCNNLIVKGTRHTIIPPVHRVYSKCKFYIVHPYFDNPTYHYSWADWGTSVLIQVKNDSGKARNSIRMFELASLEMSELRAGVKIINRLKAERQLSQADEALLQRALNYK